jgi:hypothetical protein
VEEHPGEKIDFWEVVTVLDLIHDHKIEERSVD